MVTVLSRKREIVWVASPISAHALAKFARYAFEDSRIVFFCCGIYVASFMNDGQVDITTIEGALNRSRRNFSSKPERVSAID